MYLRVKKVISIFHVLAIAFSLATILGCSQSDNNKHESLLLQAYRLIDEGRADEAILMLTDEISSRNLAHSEGADHSNETTQLRVALASAYAKKAGLSIREIARAWSTNRQMQDSLLKFEQTVDFGSKKEGDIGFKKLAVLATSYLKLMQTLSIIPSLDEDQLKYMNQAIKILDSSKKLNTSDHIYSAILKIVYVKSRLLSEEFSKSLPKVSGNNNDCVISIFKFREFIKTISSVLIGAFDNLIAAMPKDVDKFTGDQKKMVDIVGQISDYSIASTIIYSINSGTLDSLFISFGLRPPDASKCYDDE